MSKRAQSSSSYRAASSSGVNKRNGNGGGRSISPSRRGLNEGSGSVSLVGPYGLQQDERRPQTSHRLIDKQSILWRDFQNGLARRKKTLNKLREVSADGSSTSAMLKRLLLEIRQMTLRIIEDSLELEYKANAAMQQESTNNRIMAKGTRTAFQNPLPPIASFKGMTDAEDVLALADIVNDVDDLFQLPNVRVFLPVDFPSTRNPFLLGKSVDDLAIMVAPQPEAGNLEDELKVRESFKMFKWVLLYSIVVMLYF